MRKKALLIVQYSDEYGHLFVKDEISDIEDLEYLNEQKRKILKQVTSKFISLDDLRTQEALAGIIYLCLNANFKVKLQYTPYLIVLSETITSLFTDLTYNSPQFEKVIKWFCYHIYVIQDGQDSFCPPLLIKINNHIYFEIEYESSYPSEILSIINESQCPLIFRDIHSKDKGWIRALKKYLFKNTDNTEYLQLPEFPDILITQIYNFYDLLILTFSTIEFNKEDEEVAEEIFNYLFTMRDFFDINEN
jgi:hypothetical protein